MAEIDRAMQDNKTTIKEIQKRFENLGISMSATTILNGRKKLGWTFRGTAYCQMIRAVNKEKRLAWAQANKDGNFEDVIWTDETSVQLENHRQFCCRKRGEKPRYTNLVRNIQLSVWAGISWNGLTNICIFDGIMNAEVYTQILTACLVPFLKEVYPSGHPFMQDNDSKHTSRHAQSFFEDNGINWWRMSREPRRKPY